ncbi:NADH dehydrogenase-like complex subunit M [Natronomonas pharaonis DSM 2160]|uniref:NADH dehydrogenase-like complex subunit M n=1 Tax=Natronomonas pharaonis (strain ATCC 35678 / DSM 2160 / CIP 103997 / JCM 8858 / NBRC 14720 / NCIMB 2260 / Gabara) TaxID=348780 RepID=A0A1U7EVZ6_NATPD|nr:NuoM family protein [Natronomonas pharaonis]CAI49247.1 NADH dehydrogenase-like complex subunit M [Natronomonas pharaonis DSM 2160]
MFIEALILLCLVGAAAVFIAPDRYAHKLALGLSVPPLVVSLYMYAAFDGSGNALLGGDIAYETATEWLQLGQYTVSYHVGLDGISLPLVVLSTVLTTLAILSAWTPIDERQSEFYGLVLLLEGSLIGVFAALDFILWFVFWEAVLIPMYLLIGVWGGPRRKYAAIKFFVYTNIASLVMFIGYFALVFGLGDAVSSTGMPAVAQALRADQLGYLGTAAVGIGPDMLAMAAFLAMFVGFAVKVPVVPFHTWLPDAHVEAPTPVSVLLAGVLLKMGTYALLRFNFTMLPDQVETFAVPIALIAIISILYGALLALAQKDLKRIVAYSSVSSMGYVILGLVAYTVYGVGGATFQMIAHGLISGLLFMTVGVFYNATHTRMVGDMGGLADRMPVTAGIFIAGAFGYMGLPLMAGFMAELFVFIGAFQSAILPYAPVITAAGMFGIVVVAGYLLWAMQRSLFGPFRLETDYELERAPVHDIVPLLTLVALIIALGVAPDLIFEMIRDATHSVIDYDFGGDL